MGEGTKICNRFKIPLASLDKDNDEQKAKRESLLKSMIGETPQGKPHVAAVKEDDIELVNDARIKFDDAGNFAVKQKRVLEEKSLDELEAEKNGSAAKIPKNDDE